jgi:hypothetical protein
MHKREIHAVTPLPNREQLCGGPAETSLRFGIGEQKLRYLRTFGGGAPFKVIGHRTINYNWRQFEIWLDSLPGGGGVRK